LKVREFVRVETPAAAPPVFQRKLLRDAMQLGDHRI
jgi:hypothetical protein